MANENSFGMFDFPDTPEGRFYHVRLLRQLPENQSQAMQDWLAAKERGAYAEMETSQNMFWPMWGATAGVPVDALSKLFGMGRSNFTWGQVTEPYQGMLRGLQNSEWAPAKE